MRLNAITHARLMEESEARIENIARAGAPTQANIARRMLDDLQAYRRWEAEHDRLMRGIANGKNRMGQLAALRSTAFSLIHRKALFEYLRDEQVRGQRREQILAQFSSQRDYVSAVVAEHGRYVRSAASYLCSSHVGSNVMFDTLFETPLAEYEELYASYFRTYCNSMFAADDNALAKSMLPVLVDLKKQLSEWRRALVALTHSQSGVWRRPTL
jgi:hypothetical protein